MTCEITCSYDNWNFRNKAQVTTFTYFTEIEHTDPEAAQKELTLIDNKRCDETLITKMTNYIIMPYSNIRIASTGWVCKQGFNENVVLNNKARKRIQDESKKANVFLPADVVEKAVNDAILHPYDYSTPRKRY